jgi:hypothetical protein
VAKFVVGTEASTFASAVAVNVVEPPPPPPASVVTVPGGEAVEFPAASNAVTT